MERIDSQGNATVVGSSSSPDILVPSQAQEHRVVAKNKELGIRGTPSVPKRELKPEHRWQMRLPRNLLESNDSGSATNFDPASTAWQTRGDFTYGGTVSNVGPNGETAHLLDTTGSDTDLEDGLIQKISYPAQPFTWGLLVRTVSGTCDVRFGFNNQAGNSTDYAITTDWQFITHTDADFSQSGGGLGNVHIYYNPFGDNGGALANLYVLRAGLNRGSSLEYSTRSQVPQEIPDVVQGADLSNGSTSGADTNDLDFAVDEKRVSYAISDGDDQSSKIQSEHLGAATWAFRVYLPNSWSVRNPIFGSKNEYASLDASSKPFMGWSVYDPNKEFNAAEARNQNANLNSWNTCVCTIEEGKDRIRFNLNGNVVTESVSDPSAVRNNPVGLNMGVPGFAVSHFERHPVLSEAEAEAVRQRLATNPPDPVAPTEAWDSTVGSGSTLPALRQSSNDISVGASVSWVDPIGLSDGGGGSLLTPTNRSTVTWIERVKYNATRAFGRSANGWKVTATDLVVEDTAGNTESSSHGKTINDGVYHTLVVTIDEVTGTAEVYIDGATSPDATVDLSTVGTLKYSDVELLAEGGTIKQPAYYTRALSGEEIAYLHERLVDNPETAHPEYINP